MNNTTGMTPEAIGWFHYARQLQKQQLRKLTQQGTLASEISGLVHMLQCERAPPICGSLPRAACMTPSVGRAGRWWTRA